MNAASGRACAYCGLPVPAWWRATDAEPAYCCYGCRFAASVTGSDAPGGVAARWMFARLGLAIFFSMNVMVFTMALWSADVYGSVETPLAGLFRYLCLFFAAPVLWWLGVPLLDNAWASLRRGIVNTDLLLVAGVVAAYVYSTVSVLRDDGPVYFEVGCAVLLLVTLGRWLEASGRSRATSALDALAKLLPERVRMLDAHAEKALGAVMVGDRLHVRAGERVPCDGVVLKQPVWIDEQLLTGESGPRYRAPGAAVYAGTLNLDGDLFLEVTRGADAGALARIVRLIRQAHDAKGRYEQLADRITAWFLPAVAVIAVAATCYHSLHHGIDHGMMAGMAVVLIACPCALGIATPLAVWIATTTAAQRQVLFKSGVALEQLAAIRHLCFDKTGTLTVGAACRVAAWIPADPHDGPRTLERACALASSSNHPLSQAILAQAKEAPRPCEHVRTLPGRGLCGEWPVTGETIWLGSNRLMVEENLAMPEALAQPARAALVAEQPLVCVGWTAAVRGLFVFGEEMRAEVPSMLASLRELRVGVTILTGDRAESAQCVARNLGIASWSNLLPEQKVSFIANAYGPIGMVGDGINDAPALAASDVGIAMGCGADVARDCADVCLLNNDLMHVPWAIQLARRTVHVVQQNLFWAFAYNVVGIALAAADLLNPVLAAAAMALSSLLVLANSLRLRGPMEAAASCSNPS